MIRTIVDRPKRLFAIGDVHGCFDELSALINFLKEQQSLSQDDLLLFIGDYIDRGPASRQVLDLLISLRAEFPKTVFLKGNHEDMLLGYLGLGGHAGEMYLSNGGFEFFRSYRVAPLAPLSQIIGLLPAAHLEFLRSLDTCVTLAEFVFAHAGIHPEKSLAEQSPQDLIWIRSEFTKAEHTLGATVVFGHTPFEDVMLHLPYKIGIDTGIVYGNKLSCVELVEGELYQVEAGEREVRVYSLQERLGIGPK